MRDFTWQVFAQTGDIEAYMLYKEMHNMQESDVLSDYRMVDEDGYGGDED